MAIDPMDVDDDGPPQRLALIRIARTLDEDASLPLPDKIHKVWHMLSSVKATRLHSVEETVLRWLLKQMSGNTEDAELVRRYPLTWAILGLVFPKIPAQTLGRSLAYLRFVSILQKTCQDITTIHDGDSSAGGQVNAAALDKNSSSRKKRKRTDAMPSDLGSLRSPQGCLNSATEIFATLSKLLEQGSAPTKSQAPERRVGAEHIKSLFSSSSDETRDITAKLLVVCNSALVSSQLGLLRDQEHWIELVTTLWNLRLHNQDDSAEFAKHLYEPTCSILSKLKGVSGPSATNISNAVRDIWTRQLERFLSICFIRPARRRFALDGNVEMLKLALAIAKKNASASPTVMWDVAARTPRDLSEPKSKAEHASWAQGVFEVLMESIKAAKPVEKTKITTRLLDVALQTRSIPATSTLRVVCEEQALSREVPDWILIAKTIACDADVFLTDNPSCDNLFGRISAASAQDSETLDQIVTGIILPLQNAFAEARDLSGFVTRWYEALRAYTTAAPEESNQGSVWLDSRIRQQLSGIIQDAMSSTQLVRLLERLDSSSNDRGALLVVLDGICAGLRSENFIIAIDSKVFSMTFEGNSFENSPSEVSLLRWRIAGYMAAWETSEECYRLWDEIKSPVKRLLKKGSLSDDETFEAFSCCYKLCHANHIGGKHESELIKLICSFLERLISTIKSTSDPLKFTAYLDLVFRQLPKLAEQPKQETNKLSDLTVQLFWHISQILGSNDDTALINAVRPLLCNIDVEDEEPLLDALMVQPLEVLDSADALCGWTQPQSLSVILVLLEIPREAWTKARRKRIMASWKKWQAAISTHASHDPRYAIAVLRLLIRVMQQPTFYEGMSFGDLIHVCVNVATDNPTVLAMTERFVDLTLRQMSASNEEASVTYFKDAANYIRSSESKQVETLLASTILAKGLLSALHKSSTVQHADLSSDVAIMLTRLVKAGLQHFANRSLEVAVATRDHPELVSLDVILDGAARLVEARPEVIITMPSNTLLQLETASRPVVIKDINIGWKLRTFLLQHRPGGYDPITFYSLLEEGLETEREDGVYGFVDAFFQKASSADKHLLHQTLMSSEDLASGPIGLLLAARRLLELQGPSKSSPASDAEEGPKFPAIYQQFSSLLCQATTLRHFQLISDGLLYMLDKHASSMTQFNIETTLSAVAEVCSARDGPKLSPGPHVAGEVYECLYKLVATVIRRHRLRLRGHFPVLLGALRALLYTLLSPTPLPHKRDENTTTPPWLTTSLQPRHADRFARLLTLVCEPSAASVASSRQRSQELLDSATAAAKRAAGQHMHAVVLMYLRRQLAPGVAVSRNVRAALQVGLHSVLDITPPAARRVLNESMDAAGRALFRQLWAEYRKFGRWSGV
ncbi:Urb2/Npa2 family-domain-containing protein [Xylariomycetidae sp. FL0641]|nr:Urb2/Npa2 family-domain-containing protein [Xylariomycetidae sp. FL0641]